MLSPVPRQIQTELEDVLGTELTSFSFVGGGCINHGGKLVTKTGVFFLKWNDVVRFPGMFEAEARGLRLLQEPNVIHVPKVVAQGNAGSFQFLVLEFVHSKPNHAAYWDLFGEQLANLHCVSSGTFGLDHNNFIGSLPQINSQASNWIDFFVERRLAVQVKLAIDTGKLAAGIARQFEGLCQKLPSFLPQEKPALLHGDLWSGNLITNGDGMPCLIDPAAYFGNREIELAFTELFGGFSDRFYEAYDSHFKLQPGYRSRVQLYQLYPLLVHANLFGGGYVSQVVSILKKFV